MLIHDGLNFLPIGSKSFNKKIGINWITQILRGVFARLRENIFITLKKPVKK